MSPRTYVTNVWFQWQKNEAHLPGETNATLTIVNAQFSDAANYSVIATDGTFVEELITNVALQDGGMGIKADQTMELRGTAGRRYTLETSTNLANGSFWKTFSADASISTLNLPRAANGNLYYRAILAP